MLEPMQLCAELHSNGSSAVRMIVCWGCGRYTSASTAVQHFLEALTELDSADQRRFLRFVTGSPSLPPGGVAALQPR